MYNRLDTLIAWYVDDYVDFDDRQEAVFEASLAALFEWHRREELPRYIALLEFAEQALLDGLDDAELTTLEDEARDALDRLQWRALDAMLEVGETLSAEQLGDFLDRQRERQAESAEEWLSRDEAAYRADLVDRLEDTFEDYLGNLTRRQQRLIADRVGDYVRLDGAWLEDRRRWLDRLDALLRDPQPDWPAAVREAVSERFSERAPAFAADVEHNTAVTRTLIRDVINQRTPRQNHRLQRRLRDLKADFQALISP